MTGLVLLDTSTVAVIESRVQHKKTFEASYGASFDEMRISNVCKDVVFCRLLQGATEAMYWSYLGARGPMRRYPETFQLVEEVEDEAAASSNAGGKGRGGIAHCKTALLLQSQKWDAVFFIEAAAVYTKENMKDIGTATLFDLIPLYFYAAMLFEGGKTSTKRPFQARSRHSGSF